MRRSPLLSALTVLLLAGCSSAVTGSGTFGREASGTLPAPTSGSVPTSASASVSTPTPTPTPSAPSSSAGAGGLAFTTVSFPVPTGFEPGVGYGEAVPLEASAPIQDFIVPTGGQGGLDIISVIVYELPSPNLAPTQAQQVARVKLYNAKLRARIVNGVQAARVAGLPALTESIVQPGGSQNPRGYRYTTWFVFGTTHLLQVSCQTDKPAAAQRIVSGCSTVLGNMKVS